MNPPPIMIDRKPTQKRNVSSVLAKKSDWFDTHPRTPSEIMSAPTTTMTRPIANLMPLAIVSLMSDMLWPSLRKGERSGN